MSSNSGKGLTRRPVGAPLGRSVGSVPLRPHAEPSQRGQSRPRQRPEFCKLAIGAILVLACLCIVFSSMRLNPSSRYKASIGENKEESTSIVENKKVEIAESTLENKNVKSRASILENEKVEIITSTVKNKKEEILANNMENKHMEIPVSTMDNKKIETPVCIVENKNIEISPSTMENRKVEIPMNSMENKEIEIPMNTLENKEIKIPMNNLENKEIKILTNTLENKEIKIPACTIENKKIEVSECIPENKMVGIPASIVENEKGEIQASNVKNKVVDGIHIFSWINYLDLRMLAVLINSALSASRFPDDVFFHFFVPPEEDEKLSYYKLKVVIPNSNLEIISQNDVKKKLKLPNLRGDSMQVFLNEAAPLLVSISHLSFSKYVYLSPNSTIKGQIEDLFGTYLGPYAIGAAENCEKRLGDFLNIETLNAVQRTAAKRWVSDKPYDKNACMPDFSLILVDPRKLDDTTGEAIMWWIYVLDLEVARGDHVRLAMALSLHNNYLKLPSYWKLEISKNDETKIRGFKWFFKAWIIIGLLAAVFVIFLIFVEYNDQNSARTSREDLIGMYFFFNISLFGLFLFFYFSWSLISRRSGWMSYWIIIGLLVSFSEALIIYLEDSLKRTIGLINLYFILYLSFCGVFLIFGLLFG